MAGQTVNESCFCASSAVARGLAGGRVLTFAQLRQQNDLPVGKLKGVMMNV
jgi:hypothetical protein